MLVTLFSSELGLSPTDADTISTTILVGTVHCFISALKMLEVDSNLMDLSNETIENSGFLLQRRELGLHAFENDDECEDKTRFTKDQIRMLIEALDLPEIIRVDFYDDGTGRRDGRKYYKFNVEEIFIYMCRKMSTASTHKQLSDTEFGGCARRWGVGYNWLVKYIDRKMQPLIGPEALRIWAPQFPYFAESIREYIQKDKERTDRYGNQTTRGMQYYIPPGTFNVFSITDCTTYEICRPGSGPINDNAGAGRRHNWYIKQRAYYDGYHRAFQACVKILTICLPNGMTAAVYGPTSGRRDDRTLFRLAEFDEFLVDLCTEFHGADHLYATYGDGIFAGYWYCLRTRHEAAPGLPLTVSQEEMNDNMKLARECVEWSYARAEQLWPMLNTKDGFKLEEDSERMFAEIRVIYWLTNCKVCTSEGSTMTGTRGFQCPPPSLEDYLSMLPDDNNNNLPLF